MKSERRDYYISVVIFVAFFLLILSQYRNVFMYFDDYGYVSLSYAVNGLDIRGTDYSFLQIVEFLKLHYVSWGGRIFTYFLDIVLLRDNIWLMRIFLSLLITFIFVMFTYIVKKCTNYKLDTWIIALLSCMLYGFIDLSVARDGIYWFVAALTYVVPCFMFLVGMIILYRQDSSQDGKRKIVPTVIVFLLFTILSSCQEQLGGALLVVYLIYLVIKVMALKRKVVLSDVVIFIGGVVGFAFLVFSPGNRVRMSVSGDTANVDESLFERIGSGITEILQTFFTHDFCIFLILMTITTIMLSILFIKNRNNIAKISGYLLLFISLVLLVISIKTQGNVYAVAVYCPVSVITVCLVMYIFLTVMMTVWFYLSNKRYLILICFLYGFISVGALIVSPVITLRSFLPFMLIYFLFSLDVLCCICNEFKGNRKKVLIVITIVLMFGVAILNFGRIYQGYKKNSACMEYNDMVLKEASQTKTTGDIYLSKLWDDRFGYTMPYVYDNWTTDFMKRYYDLSEDINFVWKNPEEILIEMGER